MGCALLYHIYLERSFIFGKLGIALSSHFFTSHFELFFGIFFTFLFQINILHRVGSLYEPLVEAVKGTPGKKHSNLNYIRTSFTFWGENVGRGRIFSHFLRTNKGRQCLHNPHIGGGGGQTIQQRRGKTLSSLLLFCFPEGKQHPKSPPKKSLA